MMDIKANIGTDIMVNISGGEPLMRKDLFEIMGEVSKLGFDWGMVSNGVLITDRCDELLDYVEIDVRFQQCDTYFTHCLSDFQIGKFSLVLQLGKNVIKFLG